MKIDDAEQDTYLFASLVGLILITCLLTLVANLQRLHTLYTTFIEGTEWKRCKVTKTVARMDHRTEIQNRRKAEKRKRAERLQRC